MILISAGDALTAKLIEKHGYDGIWVSGFEMSARLGLQDNGSITMTEMINMTKPIVDAVNIPVFVDIDTGYGNFERTLKEFERIGVYCVCVEDNVDGHKINSLWGGNIPLMGKKEFCAKLQTKRGKIKVMARTEALIRGLGMDEAEDRARAYSPLSDYVLVHTRDQSGKEMTQIAERMNDIPYKAIVPTKFPWAKNDTLRSLGYEVIIWANQAERVKLKAIDEMLTSLELTDKMERAEEEMCYDLNEFKELADQRKA